MQVKTSQFKNGPTLKQYESKVASIYKQRKLILMLINERARQKKFLQNQQAKVNLQKKAQTETRDTPRKQVKKDNQRSQNTAHLDQDLKNSHKEEEKIQTKIQEKNPPVPRAIFDRNRRVFEGLTSYLKKAGDHLNSKESQQKQQHAKQILNKFIQKEKEERAQTKNKKKSDIELHLTALQQGKAQNEQKLRRAQNQLLCFVIKSHFEAQKHFYQTQTEPKIFWKPKKIFDSERHEKTKQQGQKSKRQEEFIGNIMNYKEPIDQYKLIIENEKEFYNNFIKNLGRKYHHCILTKEEPEIFWKPRKHFKGFQELAEQSALRFQSSVRNKIAEFHLSKTVPAVEDPPKQYSQDQNESSLEADAAKM